MRKRYSVLEGANSDPINALDDPDEIKRRNDAQFRIKLLTNVTNENVNHQRQERTCRTTR